MKKVVAPKIRKTDLIEFYKQQVYDLREENSLLRQKIRFIRRLLRRCLN